jgi:hypothetical protein
MMGEEIEWAFNPSDLQPKNQTNLTLEETSEALRLKYEVAFALLIVVFLHMLVMLNELDNLPRLDTILNGKPIGLRNHLG